MDSEERRATVGRAARAAKVEKKQEAQTEELGNARYARRPGRLSTRALRDCGDRVGYKNRHASQQGRVASDRGVSIGVLRELRRTFMKDLRGRISCYSTEEAR